MKQVDAISALIVGRIIDKFAPRRRRSRGDRPRSGGGCSREHRAANACATGLDRGSRRIDRRPLTDESGSANLRHPLRHRATAVTSSASTMSPASAHRASTNSCGRIPSPLTHRAIASSRPSTETAPQVQDSVTDEQDHVPRARRSDSSRQWFPNPIGISSDESLSTRPDTGPDNEVQAVTRVCESEVARVHVDQYIGEGDERAYPAQIPVEDARSTVDDNSTGWCRDRGSAAPCALRRRAFRRPCPYP